jgi:hypothetical protein
MRYVAIRSEGGLIPYDLLDKIANEDASGQKPSDFGLPKGRRLTDEISRVWSDAQSLWDIIRRRRESLSEKDPYGTTLTRDRWIVPLLSDAEMLGFDLRLQPSGAVVDNLTFNLSHRSGEGEDAIPVHIEGLKIDLDKRLHTKLRTSPQAMVQEFLNHSETVLWGVVTNGLTLRLLRDSSRTSRPTYVEFDLESILEGNRFAEFALFYRLCHRSRFPRPGQDPSECILEKYYLQSIDEGSRVREGLRAGVEETLKIFGNAFLQHPANRTLCEKLTSGRLNPVQYHRQLLLLVYRLLFLMVAEERRLIVSQGEGSDSNQKIYDQWYSVSALRDRASRIIEESPFGDVWLGLLQTFSLFEYGVDSNPLGIPPLNGDLFNQDRAVPDLVQTQLYNHDLLRAVRHLSVFKADGLQQRVNYAALDVEELGSVYESLLDYQPVVEPGETGLKFDLQAGSERKSTGSYYTRPELVHELIENALVPVMEDRIAQAEKTTEGKDLQVERDAKIKAILAMTVCDAACGSGHFLLAAARRLGKELARIKTGEDEPTPKEFHLAVREVIQHCIYGVDLNPLAVDLCKLAMWLEGHWAGKPLSFLDHRIRCGNSLVGVLDTAVLEDGIPDDAFTAVAPDEKNVASYFKRRNKQERLSKQRGFSFEFGDHGDGYAKANRELSEIQEDTAAAVRRKAELYSSWRAGMQHFHDQLAADLWTAQFFLPLTAVTDPVICTTKDFLEFALDKRKKPQQVSAAEDIAQQFRFFHWHLEFPEVTENGGFDVMLGNPPFINIIDGKLPLKIKHFITTSDGRLTGTADVAYHFVSLADRITRKSGRIGLIQPRSVLSADSALLLRRDLMAKRPPAFLHVPRSATFFEGVSAYVCLLALGGAPQCAVTDSDILLSAPAFQGRVLLENWWSSFVSILTGQPQTDAHAENTIAISDMFTVVGSMTTAEAYMLKEFIVEGGCGPKLVTTGLIDPFNCKWGEEPCRYLGVTYDAPRIDIARQLPPPLGKRVQESLRPKLLVAGLSNRIEACFDRQGELCGVVSTFSIFHPTNSLDALEQLCSWLNRDESSHVLRMHLGASSVGGGYMTIKKKVLQELRIPKTFLLEREGRPHAV